jgi:hypothetical protein
MGERAHFGTVGTNPRSCRPRPPCCCASATSSSTRYAHAWFPTPGEYAWSSYRANALALADPILSGHPLYLALGAGDASRREAYRNLFRTALDDAPLADLRMASNQDQPIGNSRFYAEIEAMTGQRRELRKRGRPRRENEKERLEETSQQQFPFLNGSQRIRRAAPSRFAFVGGVPLASRRSGRPGNRTSSIGAARAAEADRTGSRAPDREWAPRAPPPPGPLRAAAAASHRPSPARRTRTQR